MVVADASSDASTNLTLSIAPPIRKTPADNTIVDYSVPVVGVFMLAGPASWTTNTDLSSNFNFVAAEDVLA